MKHLFLSFTLLLIIASANAQSLHDTIFWFKSNGALSYEDSADYYIEVHKNSDGTYRVQKFEKNNKNEWKPEAQSTVITIIEPGILKEEFYYKKKLSYTTEIKWNKTKGSLYHFEDNSSEYYSKFPIPITQDSIQTRYFSDVHKKHMEGYFKDNICESYTLFDRSGKIIGRDVKLYCEKRPSYDGKNLDYFREVVQREIVYPPVAVENGIFGRVTIQFIVNSDGSLGEILILRGVDKSLDDECIRAIKATKPLWTPGYDKGKPVNVMMVMPLIFQLQ